MARTSTQPSTPGKRPDFSAPPGACPQHTTHARIERRALKLVLCLLNDWCFAASAADVFSGVRPSSGAAVRARPRFGRVPVILRIDTLLLPRTAALRASKKPLDDDRRKLLCLSMWPS